MTAPTGYAAQYDAEVKGWWALVRGQVWSGPFSTSAKALKVARAAWANPKGVQTK